MGDLYTACVINVCNITKEVLAVIVVSAVVGKSKDSIRTVMISDQRFYRIQDTLFCKDSRAFYRVGRGAFAPTLGDTDALLLQTLYHIPTELSNQKKKK